MQITATHQTSRQALRQELRTRRRALSPDQQIQASHDLLRKLMSLPLFLRSKHIALYWAADGEIDLASVAKQLWKMGKHCYLPVIHPLQKRQLWFVEYLPNSQLKSNRFKIPEPDPHHALTLPAHLLDIVLLPLVGFDVQGSRLGMGGGYYDATFAFKQQQHTQRKPWLLGVAHSCQQVDSLATAAWDIRLHGVVTDNEIFLAEHPQRQE